MSDSHGLPVENIVHRSPQQGSTGTRLAAKVLDRGRLRTVLVVVLCLLARPSAAGFVTGVSLVVLGCGLHVWAKGCLRICREVTTSGPYRWVRNPFYLAALVIEAGYCVAAGVPQAFPFHLLAWYLTYRRTIRREERTLRRLFGERFVDYVRAVPRLVPWRGRVRGVPESRPFDWANPNLAQGREYARVARILMPPFLFVAAAAVHRGGPEVSLWTALSMSALALLLLGIVRRAAFRRFKEGLSSLPAVVRTPAAAATAVAVFCAVGGSAQWPGTGGDALAVAGEWLATGAAILALGALPFLARRRPLLLLLQSAACFGAGLATGHERLGAVAGAWFVLLAIEAAERPASPASCGARGRAAGCAAEAVLPPAQAAPARLTDLTAAAECVPRSAP